MASPSIPQTDPDQICAHYTTLQVCALEISAPVRDRLRTWLSSYKSDHPPAPRNVFTRFAKAYFDHIFVFFATPLRFEKPGLHKNFWRAYISIISVLVFFLSLITSLGLLFIVFYRPQSAAGGGGSLSPYNILIFFAAVMLVLFLVPATYVRLYYLVINRPKTRYHPVLLAVYLGLLSIIVFLPVWPASVSSGTGQPGVLSAIQSAFSLLFARNHLVFSISLLFLFIIPAYTQIFTVLLDALIWLLWSVWLAYDAFIFFHHPTPVDRVRDLATRSIPIQNGFWSLCRLEPAEINTIKEWAGTNRESTDKKLLPSIVLISVLQFFGWNTIFGFITLENISLYARKILTDLFSSEFISIFWAFGQILLLGLAIALLLIPIRAIYALFRNLLTQSMVLEACIVAGYLCEQEKNSLTQAAAARPRRKSAGFWQWLFRA